MYHEKIDGLIDRYARKLAENINQSNLIDARVPSVLIAGGSNFPVRKKEKQNAARDKNMGEYMQIEGLLDKVRSTGMGGISADDDRAVEKLEAKLAGLEAMQEEMKTVNGYCRKQKTLAGCPVKAVRRGNRKAPVLYGIRLAQKSRTLSVLSAYQQQRQHPPHTPAH